jgi:hypothetical protein
VIMGYHLLDALVCWVGFLSCVLCSVYDIQGYELVVHSPFFDSVTQKFSVSRSLICSEASFSAAVLLWLCRGRRAIEAAGRRTVAAG